MTLSAIIQVAKNELVCDLAQVYGIFDYKNMPARLIATLAIGLEENSRVMKKLAGQTYNLQEMLLATIADRLSLLIYMQRGDKRAPKPELLTEILAGNKHSKKKTEVTAYLSPDEFEAAKRKILEG